MPLSLRRSYSLTCLAINRFHPRELILRGTEALAAAGITTARLDASLLLAHALGVTRERALMLPDEPLAQDKITRFEELVVRRRAHEPIAYITGKKEFYSLDFIVTGDTLIPRPDSETLVEAALDKAEKRAKELAKPLDSINFGVLDIGTGTGCLLIALLKQLPSARGVGVDISLPALRIAAENASMHNVEERIRFIESNWFDAIEGTFDLIISNPPYIAIDDSSLAQDVRRYEPHLALFAGGDGMDAYRAIMERVGGKLNPGGYILLEAGKGQAGGIAALMSAGGLEVEEIRKDLAGVGRCVAARKR